MKKTIWVVGSTLIARVLADATRPIPHLESEGETGTDLGQHTHTRARSRGVLRLPQQRGAYSLVRESRSNLVVGSQNTSTTGERRSTSPSGTDRRARARARHPKACWKVRCRRRTTPGSVSTAVRSSHRQRLVNSPTDYDGHSATESRHAHRNQRQICARLSCYDRRAFKPRLTSSR